MFKPGPILAVLLIVGTAAAQDKPEDQTRLHRKGPPQAALDACSNLVEGDPCSVESRRGEIVEGSCFTPDSEKPLACRPDDKAPRESL